MREFDNFRVPRFAIGVHEVAGINLRIAMDIAAGHGLAAGEILHGLGVTEEELRNGRRRRYSWETYAEILDRVAVVLGGPEKIATAGEGVPGVFPEGAAMVSAFVSPRLFYRFINLVLEPVMFPMFRVSVVDRPDNHLLVTWELLPGYRESAPFLQASLGTLRAASTAIGLPPARVEPLELTGTRGVYLVELPMSLTLVARVKRRASDTFSDQVLHDVMRDKADLFDSFVQLQGAMSELEEREGSLAAEVQARRRLQSSLEKVLDTVSNAAFFVSDDSVVSANAAGTLALESQGEALRAELTAAVR